eukprot:9717124-Prorocentrum_lima.AAC.1
MSQHRRLGWKPRHPWRPSCSCGSDPCKRSRTQKKSDNRGTGRTPPWARHWQLPWASFVRTSNRQP